MEHLTTILYAVLLGLGIIFNVLSLVVAMKKRKTKKENSLSISDKSDNGNVILESESAESDSVFERGLEKCIYFINEAEDLFKRMGIKEAGQLKLDRVVDKMRNFFNGEKVAFDENKWVDIIENILSTPTTNEEESKKVDNIRF